MSTRGSFGRFPGTEREREKWESETGKGRMSIQGVLISELSLLAPELHASGDLWEAA